MSAHVFGPTGGLEKDEVLASRLDLQGSRDVSLNPTMSPKKQRRKPGVC